MLGYKHNIDRKDVEIGSGVKRFTSGQYVIEEIYHRDDSAWDLANISEEKYKRRKREIERKIKELDKKGSPEANYVDITPEVKEIAEEGFSYFMPEPSSGGTNLKGFINDVQNLRNFY